MSGGHFNYDQYKIGAIADELEDVIEYNEDDNMNSWGSTIGRFYSPATIAELERAVKALRVAEVYAQRADWLLSGDDGEESFLIRLANDLSKLEL